MLVLAAPIPVFLVISGAHVVSSTAVVTSMIMVWAIGHHLPGMMRAYGDPGLFQRFKIRFLVAPVMLIGVCFWSIRQGLSGVHVIIGIWGWWHYLMQTYGFVRIYDAKVGSFAATTRWLDWAMCFVWFAAAIVLSDNTAYGFLQRFYNSGFPIPSAGFMNSLRAGMIVAASTVTLLFVANFVNLWLNGKPPGLIKIVLMGTTFAYFWYSTSTVTNIAVAYAFFELFHDVQYLTIVWAFNRNRVEKDPNLGGFTRFLFRPRFILIATYVVLVCGYGLLNLRSEQINDGTARDFLVGCFLASTLLHYYFDGFIWKVREKDTQKIFEITAVESSGLNMFDLPGWLRHAAVWLLFVVPITYMTHTQGSFQLDPTEDAARILQDIEFMHECVPRSLSATFYRGLALERSGKIDEAAVYYREAQKIAPHHTPSRDRLFAIYNQRDFRLSNDGQR